MQCPSCQSLFSSRDDVQETPRILSCGHTLCTKCTQSTCRNVRAQVVMCPTCTQPTGGSCVPIDRTCQEWMQKLLQASSSSSSVTYAKVALCQNCQKAPLDTYCPPCRVSYCRSCAKSIHEQPVFLSHIAQWSTGPLPQQPPMCSVHADQLCVYACTHCLQLLCSVCAWNHVSETKPVQKDSSSSNLEPSDLSTTKHHIIVVSEDKSVLHAHVARVLKQLSSLDTRMAKRLETIRQDEQAVTQWFDTQRLVWKKRAEALVELVFRHEHTLVQEALAWTHTTLHTFREQKEHLLRQQEQVQTKLHAWNRWIETKDVYAQWQACSSVASASSLDSLQIEDVQSPLSLPMVDVCKWKVDAPVLRVSGHQSKSEEKADETLSVEPSLSHTTSPSSSSSADSVRLDASDLQDGSSSSADSVRLDASDLQDGSSSSSFFENSAAQDANQSPTSSVEETCLDPKKVPSPEPIACKVASGTDSEALYVVVSWEEEHDSKAKEQQPVVCQATGMCGTEKMDPFETQPLYEEGVFRMRWTRTNQAYPVAIRVSVDAHQEPLVKLFVVPAISLDKKEHAHTCQDLSTEPPNLLGVAPPMSMYHHPQHKVLLETYRELIRWIEEGDHFSEIQELFRTNAESCRSDRRETVESELELLSQPDDSRSYGLKTILVRSDESVLCESVYGGYGCSWYEPQTVHHQLPSILDAQAQGVGYEVCTHSDGTYRIRVAVQLRDLDGICFGAMCVIRERVES